MEMKKVDEKFFGTKMQQLRQMRKVSLEKLASETGLSQRYLRGIEDGTITPPVSTVLQVAKALAVDSGSFLSAEKHEASEKRKRESFFKRTQAYAYQTLTPDAATKHMKAFLITIDPRQDHKMVEYRHDGEEFLYILKGHIEAMVGEERHHLKKGDSLHFNSGLTHKLRNLGDDKAKLIVVIYTP
jgi:quercetin dioxygenase-like cupin family protein